MNGIRAIILGECSQAITSRARAAGHDCFSVDLKPAAINQAWHFQGSWDHFIMEPHRLKQFQLVIWHPECTKVCVSGNWVYAKGKARHAERLEALDYIAERWRLIREAVPYAALENPRGVLRSRIGQYSDSVQPYEFGEDASKTTDLWLHNLLPLKRDPAKRVPGRLVCCGKPLPDIVGKYGCPWCGGEKRIAERWANQTDSGQNRLGPGETRAADRAETYGGIADAIVSQWFGK